MSLTSMQGVRFAATQPTTSPTATKTKEAFQAAVGKLFQNIQTNTDLQTALAYHQDRMNDIIQSDLGGTELTAALKTEAKKFYTEVNETCLDNAFPDNVLQAAAVDKAPELEHKVMEKRQGG